jgi:hypothetical protein
MRVGFVQARRWKEETFVTRLVFLATATLMAMLILVPIAMAQEEEEAAQEETVMEDTVMEEEAAQEEPVMREPAEPLPASGGLPVASVLVPAAALLLGSGVVAYAVLRRR